MGSESEWMKRTVGTVCGLILHVCARTTGLWQVWREQQGSAGRWYSVTSLSECVIARQPGHLKIKEAISPLLPLSFCHHANPSLFFIQFSTPLFLSLSLSLSKSFSSNSLFLFVSLCKSSLSLLHLQLHYVSLKTSFALSQLCFLLAFPLFFSIHRHTVSLLLARLSNHMWIHTEKCWKEPKAPKAIMHSTTCCLLCHIKGEWVIFQLQFTVTWPPAREQCGDVCAHMCVHSSVASCMFGSQWMLFGACVCTHALWGKVKDMFA